MTDPRQTIRDQVQKALKTGVLVREPCEHRDRGDCSGHMEAHHEDYSKPLKVRWLCRRHHNGEHARLRRARQPKPLPLEEHLRLLRKMAAERKVFHVKRS